MTALMPALDILCHPQGLALSRSKVIVSTGGLQQPAPCRQQDGSMIGTTQPFLAGNDVSLTVAIPLLVMDEWLCPATCPQGAMMADIRQKPKDDDVVKFDSLFSFQPDHQAPGGGGAASRSSFCSGL
jgi:hypothetical protein